MNTTAPRVKAGGPPPLQLHRGVSIPSAYKPRGTKLQIDFVLPDEDEDAVRAGFDRVMKMPIEKPAPVMDSTREYSTDVRASNFAFWLWGGATWTAIWFFLGVVYASYFS